ncbi:MAG: hypothetical protein ACLFM7_10360 [Bacteroidales bacterium]
MNSNQIRIRFQSAFLWLVSLLILMACSRQKDHEKTLEAKDIQAYCIDFNWGEGGPNAFKGDAKNIATLVRAYNGLSRGYVDE